MKVYVLIFHEGYGGSWVKGVFSSKENALEYQNALPELDKSLSSSEYYDIEERVVDECFIGEIVDA